MISWKPTQEKFEVTDEGIIFIQYCDNYASHSIVIPKETFIEAYNKYIKEANHVDTDSE